MCEHLHYESVYFKELRKEQEYYIQSGGSCSVDYLIMLNEYYYKYFREKKILITFINCNKKTKGV